jgi:hypothetical protein
MDGLRALLCSMVFLAAAPAMAQAPVGTAKFDGTYAGVSSSTGSGSVRCPELGTPSPMIVANGAARTQAGGMDGTVAPDGSVRLHNKGGDLYLGKIDGSGRLEVGGGSNRCSFTLIWQKR